MFYSSAATSLSTEWFTQFRKDGTHLEPFAQFKGMAEFLAGHISHCQRQFICVGINTGIFYFIGISRRPLTAAGICQSRFPGLDTAGTGNVIIHSPVIHFQNLSDMRQIYFCPKITVIFYEISHKM